MTSQTPHSGFPTEPVDWDALARYLAEESSPEEADAMRRWLEADPERAQRVTALDRSIGRLALPVPTDVAVEDAWRRVAARLDAPDVVSLPDRAARRPVPAAARWRRPALRAAAVVALTAGGALLWRSTRDAEGPAAAVSFATAVGARDSVRLSDGSLAILGPRSLLTLAAGYGETSRDVALDGQAFFDVKHDDALPFVVRAGAATIRDLGTAFSVRADTDTVHVVVTSGSVLLRGTAGAANSGVVLHQGDRGVLRPDGRVVARRQSATEDDLAWMRGRLVFRDAPLAQVATELREWYGIQLRVEEPALAARRLTASFAGEPAAQVLDVIALTLGARVERRGDTAIFRAAPPGGRPR